MFNSHYGSGIFGGGLSTGAEIVAGILALALTVLVYVFVMPEKRRQGMQRGLAILHDIFQFKSFLLEKMIKAIYVFLTIEIVVSGVFMIFEDFGAAILMILLGPIGLRILFELLMITILLAKNTTDINKKLGPLPDNRRTDSSAEERTTRFAEQVAARVRNAANDSRRKYSGKTSDEAPRRAAHEETRETAKPASWDFPDDFR